MSEPLPLTAFQFDVVIRITGGATIELGFSEADGLEMNMEYESFYEGGRNHQPVLLAKQINYGKLTLKRGMTQNRALWEWFEDAQASVYGSKKLLRAQVEVTIKSANPSESRAATFTLSNCVPVKVKAPSLNALQGGVAIEELTIAYETLSMPSISG
ncbi:MAG TPA: phage tail protein [Symbiobacteriaceae bacterium]|nr:phage tail protein [Symbiobacteriaceae bacterium]